MQTQLCITVTAKMALIRDLRFRRKEGGRKVLRNIGILPQKYAASQLRRPLLDFGFKPFKQSTNNLWLSGFKKSRVLEMTVRSSGRSF
jgi:hypothetical protein